MTADKQNNNETVVLEVTSQLYSKRDRDRLHSELQEKIEKRGFSKVVLDFTRARWFGAPILDELVVAEQMLQKRGGELRLVGSPKIDRILTAARVDRVKLFANVQSALSGFGRPFCAAA